VRLVKFGAQWSIIKEVRAYFYFQVLNSTRQFFYQLNYKTKVKKQTNNLPIKVYNTSKQK